MDGKTKYIILEEGEYRNLQRIAETKRPTVVKLTYHNLLFLSLLASKLEIYYDKVYFTLLPSSINVIAMLGEEVMLDEIFSIDLCDKYYGKTDQFISEVL